jgi:hypothetical protein
MLLKEKVMLVVTVVQSVVMGIIVNAAVAINDLAIVAWIGMLMGKD